MAIAAVRALRTSSGCSCNVARSAGRGRPAFSAATNRSVNEVAETTSGNASTSFFKPSNTRAARALFKATRSASFILLMRSLNAADVAACHSASSSTASTMAVDWRRLGVSLERGLTSGLAARSGRIARIGRRSFVRRRERHTPICHFHHATKLTNQSSPLFHVQTLEATRLRHRFGTSLASDALHRIASDGPRLREVDALACDGDF